MLEATLEHVQQVGGGHWVKINVDSDLGITWKALESAEADVRLILASTTARRLKKPQPHLGPAEVPLRRSYVLMSGHEALSTDFEQWASLSPAAQVRTYRRSGAAALRGDFRHRAWGRTRRTRRRRWRSRSPPGRAKGSEMASSTKGA